MMTFLKYSVFLTALLLVSACITQFVPETDEIQEIVVVEGLITDQYEVYTIKLSKSMPLGERTKRNPMKGCVVQISDDRELVHQLTETSPGTYSTDKETFRGEIGRKYKLRIYTNNATQNHFTYESLPMEMKPVPEIDSVYYEKVMIEERFPLPLSDQGCQIYLNTSDPEGNCRFYRWDYSETWEIRIPFSVPVNNRCWITNNSSVINIKNVSGLSDNRVDKYPLKFISDETDRLKFKYSMMINQYSLNEDEFIYWEKLQNVTEEIGSLYDITPSSIPGNIYCMEDPGEKALGFFSVSAKVSKRLFIKDIFYGIVNPYSGCISDTLFTYPPVPNQDILVWVLERSYPPSAPMTVVTYNKGCADCTVRGSIIKPEFWDLDK